MAENVERGLGLHASSRVLLALIEQGGLSREAAYELVQRDALAAADTRRPLKELLASDPAVTAVLPASSLEACFDDAHLLRNVPLVIARLDALQPIEEAVG
jgi:adenylosuccinate lyase